MNIGSSGEFTKEEYTKTLRSLMHSSYTRFSVSVIQRRMKFGFNKSASILSELEKNEVLTKIDNDRCGYRFK